MSLLLDVVESTSAGRQAIYRSANPRAFSTEETLQQLRSSAKNEVTNRLLDWISDLTATEINPTWGLSPNPIRGLYQTKGGMQIIAVAECCKNTKVNSNLETLLKSLGSAKLQASAVQNFLRYFRDYFVTDVSREKNTVTFRLVNSSEVAISVTVSPTPRPGYGAIDEDVTVG